MEDMSSLSREIGRDLMSFRFFDICLVATFVHQHCLKLLHHNARFLDCITVLFHTV